MNQNDNENTAWNDGDLISVPYILDHGSRRLLPDDIMELQAGNEIILVVPIDKPCKERGS